MGPLGRMLGGAGLTLLGGFELYKTQKSIYSTLTDCNQFWLHTQVIKVGLNCLEEQETQCA
jgi:hypothetical protein